MRRNIENIEIQEPPLQELKKKHSCLKGTCFTGFGCIVIFIAGALLLLKYSTGPKIETLKAVPENFPKEIPVYDKDSIESITLIPGGPVSRPREIAAYAAKAALAPILMTVENKNTGKGLGEILTWKNFKDFLKNNPPEHRDTVTIIWQDLPAGPRFIANYYRSELEKQGFELNVTNPEQIVYQFTFKKVETEGELSLIDDANKKGTDEVRMVVKIPRE